jgi:hypothetical protein
MAQRPGRIVMRLERLRYGPPELDEPMDHPGVDLQIHGDAGHPQTIGVHDALIGERVTLGQADPGRCQSLQITSLTVRVDAIQRCKTPVVPVKGAAQIVVEEVADVRFLKQEAFGKGLVARRILVTGTTGIEQKLQGQGPAHIARSDGCHRRQRAAGAVATNRDACAVQLEPSSMFAQPGQAVPGIVHGRWKLPFRSQPVVHRDHRAVGQMREVTAQRLVSGHTADSESAAMEVQQYRQVAIRSRGKKPRRQLGSIACSDVQVFHSVQPVRSDVQHASPGGVSQLGLCGGQCMHGHMSGAFNPVEHAPHGRTQKGTGILMVR